MKRLAYLLADFPVLSETFIGNEIRAMRRYGHDVHPIIMHRRHGMAQPEDLALAAQSRVLGELPRGLASAFAPSPAGVARALTFIQRQKRLPRRSLFYQGWRIASTLRQLGIGHIHAHFAGGAAAHAIVAARLAGVTASFVCHGHDVYAEAEDLPVKLGEADLAVAVCREMADDLGRIEPKARLEIVPCGIDPENFAYAPTLSHNRRLLFVGRLVEQKGLDDLMMALSLLPPGERPAIDIVGDGPLRETLEIRARKLGDKLVEFLGPRPASWFASNGARYLGLVAPFKPARDGSRDSGPLVVKEAMAIGLPVVSTAFMGVKEMLTPETGWLVKPGDPSALSHAIRDLQKLDDRRRMALVAGARERCGALFTLDRSARSLSSAIEGLAA